MRVAQTHSVVKDLVLVGGGHDHLTLLKRFGMGSLLGVRLMRVSRTCQSLYSGMLSDRIPGHDMADKMHFDLRALVDFAHARPIKGV